DTELGNLRLAVKALFIRRDALNVSTGLAIYLPTADGIHIRTPDGADLIRVSNSSVQLAPFVAVLLTPNDRLFSQAWLGLNFDTGGNTVTVNPNFFGGTRDIGSLRAATTLMADFQLGYWLYRAETGLLRGMAPFVELHYNGTVSNGSVLAAGSGFFIG